jgi:uncharacterized protein YjbJ (UPF0337 family)
MKNSNNKLKNNNLINTKDKIQGKIKEVAGEITGNEQLELKGKLQMAKAEISEKMDLKNMADDVKDKVSEMKEKANLKARTNEVKARTNEVKEHMAKKINDALDKKDNN